MNNVDGGRRGRMVDPQRIEDAVVDVVIRPTGFVIIIIIIIVIVIVVIVIRKSTFRSTLALETIALKLLIKRR